MMIPYALSLMSIINQLWMKLRLMMIQRLAHVLKQRLVVVVKYNLVTVVKQRLVTVVNVTLFCISPATRVLHKSGDMCCA